MWRDAAWALDMLQAADYSFVNLDEVWRIVWEDVSGLIDVLTPLVPPEPE